LGFFYGHESKQKKVAQLYQKEHFGRLSSNTLRLLLGLRNQPINLSSVQIQINVDDRTNDFSLRFDLEHSRNAQASARYGDSLIRSA
jgi:hypothetical protein